MVDEVRLPGTEFMSKAGLGTQRWHLSLPEKIDLALRF